MSTTPPNPTPPPGNGPGNGPGSTAYAPPPPHAPWRFVRRERGRMIAGVATGMSDAFHIDVTVVRVIWVVATIASAGIGIAAYGVCWLAFPSDERPAPLADIRHHQRNAGFIVGLGLLGLGLMIVFGALVRPFRHGGDVAWATILIGAGLAVLFLRHTNADDFTPPSAPVDTPHATETPHATDHGDSPATDSQTATAESETPTLGETSENPTASASGSPPPPPSAWTQSAPWPQPPRPRVRPPRRHSFLTPLTISLLLIGAGVAISLDNAGAAEITIAEALAGGALITGVALVVSAWFGRARGLIPVGVLLLLAAVPATALDVPLRGGIGHPVYRPLARADLMYPYQLGIGRLDLDLRSVAVAGQATYLTVKVGIGSINVDVPDSVRVVVHAHAGAGSVRVFGGEQSGWPANVTRVAPGTVPGGRLDLVVRVGAGDVHIRRFEPDGVETLLEEARR